MIITAKNILLRSIQVNNNVKFLWLNKEAKLNKEISKQTALDRGIFDAGIMISINFVNQMAVLTLMTKLLRLMDLKQTIIVLLIY